MFYDGKGPAKTDKQFKINTFYKEYLHYSGIFLFFYFAL